MLIHTNCGLIIYYKETGYTAYDAADWVKEQGKIANLDINNKAKKLGYVLGDDFLSCKIGKTGLSYRSKNEFGVKSENFTIISTDIKISR
jgi:hypothetical protein